MSTDNRVQTAARPLLGVALMALGVGILPAVSYTHLTLPTICSV